MDRPMYKRVFPITIVTVLILAAIVTIWPTQKQAVAAQPLKELAQARGISIGAAVNPDLIQNDSNYRTILDREFDMVVHENALKFDATEPNQQGVFDFGGADAVVNHAVQQNMKIRGHTLVWGSQLPGWLTNGGFNRDQLIAILRTHIQTLMDRYEGKIRDWDVVNELFVDPCCESTSNPDGLRENFWYRGIGADYIDIAFQIAREADPNAKLFLNEYGAEDRSTKADYVYNYVQKLRNRGVPIDGVGMQMHLQGWGNPAPSAQDLQSNMQRLANLGLQVQVTEMDVQIYYTQGSYQQKLEQQADIYRRVMNVCLAVSACNAFLVWGVDDNHSWLPAYTGHADEAGLLYDRNYQAKPAYYALVDALGGGSQNPTPTPPSGGTTTLNPTADRFNHANYTGTEDILYASVWQTTYLKFSLSAVGNSISSAKLRLYHERWNEQGNLVITAHEVTNDSWSETDDNSLPGAGNQIASTSIGGTGWIELDVTNFVASQKQSDGIVTIAIKAQHDLWAPFHSREHANNKPELVIVSN